MLVRLNPTLLRGAAASATLPFRAFSGGGGGAPSAVLHAPGARGPFVGALDQGTTSTRFMLFSAAGAPVATAQREHRQIFPRSGWVEHDAEEIWRRVEEVVADCLRVAGAAPRDVAGVGITNQRETVVVWDAATGAPLHNALVWQDQRGAPLCAELARGHRRGEDRFRAQTGLPLVPYFTASKLAWCLDNVSGLRAAAEAGTALAGTIDSYLVWRLTRARGGAGRGAPPPLHVTDVTNASRTLLFNIHTLQWDPALCDAFRVPARMLPAVAPSSGVLGACAPDSVLPGVPVAGILGDQQAALFGQACFSPGDAKNTYGTGCFLLMNAGEKPPKASKLLTTVAYQLQGQKPVYALEGSVAVAGSAVSWLRDNLGVISGAGEMEALAGSVPNAGERCLPPAALPTHSRTLLTHYPPPPLTPQAARCWCPPSMACLRPTGARTRGACWWASAAASLARTSRAPRWRRWRTSPGSSSPPWTRRRA